MSNWFCKEEGLDPVIKIAAFDAGYLIAKNNPALAERAIPVAEGIVATLKGGGSNDAMNSVFQQGVNTLLEQVKDPLIQANILAVLSMLSFKPETPTVLKNEQLQGLVESFLNGAKAAVA